MWYFLLLSLQAKQAHHTSAVLFPDHTFTDWQEAETMGWQQQQYIMNKSATHKPWPERTPKLLFRGSSTTGNRKIAVSLKPSDALDVEVWDWSKKPGWFKRHDRQQFLGLPDHCKHKYLLNWPGNTYSARLKYLLLCGSLVLHNDNGWSEFYYHHLQNGQHFISTAQLNKSSDLTVGLTDLIQELETNPRSTHLIAQAGQQFAVNVLSPENVREYWYKLLLAYAKLQTFDVELHPKAVPLGDSLANPQKLDRTSDCKAQHLCTNC